MSRKKSVPVRQRRPAYRFVVTHKPTKLIEERNLKVGQVRPTPNPRFDETTSRGWLGRVKWLVDDWTAQFLDPNTPLLDLPALEHNLGCLVSEIDTHVRDELDVTAEWEEVEEVRKTIKKALADKNANRRIWGPPVA